MMKRVPSFLSVIVLVFVSSSPALGSHLQDDDTVYMPFIANGNCEDAEREGGRITSSWPLDTIDSENVGSKPDFNPSTAASMTTIDASLEELASETRSILISDIYAEDSEMSHQMCGDIKIDNADHSEWILNLIEQNDSGLEGHAVLKQEKPNEVSVSVYVWQIEGSKTVASDSTEGISEEELSGPGGIGNTREDILTFWKIDAGDDPVGEFTEDHFHYVTYDLPDFQLSFMFQLQNDDEQRSTDRAVDIVVSFMSYANRSEADQMVKGWLPEDAEKVGRVESNSTGEAIQQYLSSEVADAVPEVDHPGFDEPGGIWVTYWPAESTVGVIEISLFHPRGE